MASCNHPHTENASSPAVGLYGMTRHRPRLNVHEGYSTRKDLVGDTDNLAIMKGTEG
jgi:hypothetical protein